MSDISGGLLHREVTSISSKGTDFKRTYKAVIFAGTKQFQALSVTRLDIHSDFENNYRDDIAITLLVPLGTMLDKIAPYQDDLMIKLTEKISDSYDFRETEYKAYLMEDMPNDIERASDPAYRDMNTSNMVSNVNVTFSLTLPIVEYIDAIHTGTVVRQVPPFSVLKVLFDKHLSELNLSQDDVIKSITMVEPSNYEPREQIVIPHNTRLVDLPTILQNEMGGIYSAGLGFYLSRRSLHFWPLYDVERNEEMKSRLHVYIPSSKHSTIIDSTFKKEGGLVSILASGKPRIVDDTLGQTYAQGDSVRYLDGTKAFSPMGDVKDGVINSQRASRNVEASLVNTGKRVGSVSGTSGHITSNIYKEMSKKAKLDGIYLIVQWRYSNHYLITPGMITNVYMFDGNDTREIPGIVMSITTKYELEQAGINNPTLLPSSVVTVFIKREDWRMKEFKGSGQQRNTITKK